MSKQIKHVLSNASALYVDPVSYAQDRVYLKTGIRDSADATPVMDSKALREMAKKLEEIAADLDKPKFVPFAITVDTPEKAAMVAGSFGLTSGVRSIKRTNSLHATTFSAQDPEGWYVETYRKAIDSIKDYGRSR